MIEIRKMNLTLRPVPVRVERGEPEPWRLLSDGRYNIRIGRWSPSQFAYIGIDLTPLEERIEYQSEPIANFLLEIPNWMTEQIEVS